MRPEDLRRWVAQKRDAERVERELARDRDVVPDPIAAALDLIRLGGRLQGWPVEEDAISRREDLEMYDRWARLRRRMRAS